MKTENSMKHGQVLPALSSQAVRFCFLALALLVSGFFGGLEAQAQVNSQEQAIFNYMKSAAGQGRSGMVLDPVLCKVARAKAADMAYRHYFAHVDPSGHGANYLVRQAGYSLPAGYDESPSANNIESLSAGRDTASWTWNDWMTSPPHKQHLMGQASFYAAQNHVGVGFVNIPGSEWQWYWVVITAPPSGPMVSITAPASNGTVNEDSVTVTGTTGGEPAATSVRIRAEKDGVAGAWVTANGTTSWTATVGNLAAGPNTLRVQSLAADGDVLRETTRTFRYVVLAPLTVNVTGNGTVSSGYAGTTQREVGRSYTITATPKAGSLFAGWSGAASGLSRTVTIVPVQGGTQLTATFIANPFVVGKGGYTDAFTTSTGLPGYLSLSLATNGTFTGRLKLNGVSQPFKGRFDALGSAQITFETPAGDSFALTLNYTPGTDKGVITGSLNGPGWSTDLSLDANSKSTPATPNANAGRYTIIVPGTEGENLPVGDGAATVVVGKTGTATISGVLADGQTFSASVKVTENGRLNLFAAPYAGKGMLTGTLQFHEENVSDVAGTIYWVRPANAKAAAFAAGFNTQTVAVGSRYTAPAKGEAVVPVNSGENNTSLALGDGGLQQTVVQPATLAPSNALIITTPAVTGLTAKLSPATGIFTGKFVHPVTRKSTSFRGAILQKQGAGFGFFVAGADTGYATFAPAEAQAQLQAPQE